MKYVLHLNAGITMLLDAANEGHWPKDAEIADIISAVVPSFKEHTQFERMTHEGMVVRDVSAFDVYLTTMLGRIFTEIPNQLKSSKSTISYEHILEMESIADFVRWAAERRVYALSFKGLKALLKYFKKRKWASIDMESDTVKSADEYIEVRNLIVHNSGRINKRFLSRLGKEKVSEESHDGDEFPLSLKFIGEGADALLDLAREIDEALVTHFKLPTEPPIREPIGGFKPTL